MNIPSFVPSKRIGKGLSRASSDRSGRIGTRVKKLVARGEETASGISEPLRSGSRRALQNALDRYELTVDDLHEQALEAVYEEGFAAARSVEFYDQPMVQNLLWARIPGDSLVTLGALAFTLAAVRQFIRASGTEARSTPA